MIRGPLHNRDADGLCEACGEPFPCPTGLAIFESVVQQSRWEDLEDREYHCPKCLHWWVSHGVPTEDDYGCTMLESSASERWEMSQRDRELQRQGVAPEVAALQAYKDLRYCGCPFADGNTVTPRQVRWTAP